MNNSKETLSELEVSCSNREPAYWFEDRENKTPRIFEIIEGAGKCRVSFLVRPCQKVPGCLAIAGKVVFPKIGKSAKYPCGCKIVCVEFPEITRENALDKIESMTKRANEIMDNIDE